MLFVREVCCWGPDDYLLLIYIYTNKTFAGLEGADVGLGVDVWEFDVLRVFQGLRVL